MALPSRVLNSGVTSMTTAAVCGEGTLAVTAAGSTASDATILTSIYNRVATVGSGTGVKLPPCEMGATIYLTNVGANPLHVYPSDTGSTIAGATSVLLEPSATSCFFAVTNTRWEQLQGFGGTSAQAAHGSFISTASQTAAAINTAYGITLSSATNSYLVSIGSPASRIVCLQAGTYNFQFSLQLDKTAASTAAVYIWYRVNGVDIANSATKVAINGSDAETVAAWNFLHDMNANDYFELVWSTDDTNCFIAGFAAASPVPAIPSVILTAVQIR
jgi:hypothetical protein